MNQNTKAKENLTNPIPLFEKWEDDLRDMVEKYGLSMPDKSSAEDATDA